MAGGRHRATPSPRISSFCHPAEEVVEEEADDDDDDDDEDEALEEVEAVVVVTVDWFRVMD